MRSGLFEFPNPVDEVSARLVALGVLVVSVFYLATGWWWVLVLLLWGFLARVTSGPTFSPLAQLVTRIIRPRLAWPERPTPGPPKRFAQGIGAVTSCLALVAVGLGATGVATVLVAILASFALFEAAFGFCAGCFLFSSLMRFGLVSDSICEACGDIESRLEA